MIRMMYWATWVQVTARMPPSIEQTRMPASPTKTPDVEVEEQEPAHDDADARHLRDEVGERGADGHEEADHAGGVAAITLAEEVRNRVGAELPEVGREEDRQQDVAARPARHVGQAVVAGGVEGAAHRDERGRAHPVGAGGHAVEEGGNAAAGHVVLIGPGRAAEDADEGVHADGDDQERPGDGRPRHAHLLGDGQEDREEDEPAGVDREDLSPAHAWSSWTPYLRSISFMRTA